VALQLEILSSLGELAGAWDRLAAAKRPVAPMMSSLWADREQRTFLVAMDGDEVAGGLPLKVRHRLGIEFATLFVGQYADLLACPGREREVAAAIHGWIDRGGVRSLWFRLVPERAQVAAALPGGYDAAAVTVSPWTRLPLTFEDYLAGRPSKLRKLIAEPQRRLERAGAEFVVTPSGDVSRALDEFCRLHALRWGADAPFNRTIAALRGVIPDAVARGQFALHQLVLDGSPIATNLYLQFGNLFGYWAGARDPTRHEWRGSGTVLLARSIRLACEMGYSELDFWAGDEPYKRLWTDETRTLYDIRAGAPAFASLPMVRIERLARRARRVVRRD
jgi:CelD/BcsL family acetyltransferase involved in cellulose biosynthesis